MNTLSWLKQTIHLSKIALRAIQFSFQAAPRYLLLAFITATFSAITVPAQVWIAKTVIDQVSALLGPRGQGAGSPGSASLWQVLLPPLALYLLIWAASEFFQAVSKSIQQLFCMEMDKHARVHLLKKAAGLSIAYYDSPAFHDQMEIAAGQVWRLSNVVYFSFIVLSDLAGLLALLVLLGKISLLLPLVLVAAALPQMAAQSKFMNQKARLLDGSARSQRMANYLGDLLSSRETAKEVRLYQLQDVLLDGVSANNQRYNDEFKKLTLTQERTNVGFSVLSLLGSAAAWGYAVILGLAGRISLGDIALVFQSAERSRASLNQVFFNLGFLLEHLLFLGRFFAFLDQPAEAAEGALRPAPQPALPLNGALRRGGLAFQNVTFTYPGASEPALKNLTFTLQPGHRVALVGENGAGKTTLVKLLARLYDPTRGNIRLDGHDLAEYPLEEYQRQIGILFQDFACYDLTVRENIGFGRVERMRDESCLSQAARLGGAAELIAGLPGGFEAMLGKRFEGGADLSGGEWQKIALSRAFMRDAELLILDEPTAGLDAYSEHEVYQRFADLTSGKTTVLVTHRLASVKMADQILVLQNGCLIEQGTHAELMERKGEYARMFTLQAEKYQ